MIDLRYPEIEEQLVGALPELAPAAACYWDMEGGPGLDCGPYIFFGGVFAHYVEILLVLPSSPSRDRLLRRAFSFVERMLSSSDADVRDLAFIELFEGRNWLCARSKPFIGSVTSGVLKERCPGWTGLSDEPTQQDVDLLLRDLYCVREVIADELRDEGVVDLRSRKIYQSLTEHVLHSIPDTDVEQIIVDYAVNKIGDDYDRAVVVVRSLALGIQALYSTRLVQWEVERGGFHQFFWSRSAAFAEAAVGGFEFFGLTDLAGLTREAITMHATKAAQIEAFKREGRLEALSESYKHTKLEPLDERFLELSDTISSARIKRIRAQPQLFTGS